MTEFQSSLSPIDGYAVGVMCGLKQSAGAGRGEGSLFASGLRVCWHTHSMRCRTAIVVT